MHGSAVIVRKLPKMFWRKTDFRMLSGSGSRLGWCSPSCTSRRLECRSSARDKTALRSAALRGTFDPDSDQMITHVHSFVVGVHLAELILAAHRAIVRCEVLKERPWNFSNFLRQKQ